MRLVLAVTAYRIQYAGEHHGNKVSSRFDPEQMEVRGNYVLAFEVDHSLFLCVKSCVDFSYLLVFFSPTRNEK